MSLNNVVVSEQNECSEDELFSRKEQERMLSPEEDHRRLLAKEKLGQEKLLTNKKWNSENEIFTSEPISLKLQFIPVKISSPVLTGMKIEGEGCESINVALVDCLAEKIVNSGPEASAKVEIVALEGGFDSDEDDNWTSEKFENKIVREKSLVGNVNLKLKKGIVSLGDIHFIHTKKYRRNCEFRLGARVVDNFNSIRVKEAKTESFTVKDGRRKYNGKHHPPSPSDEVWRLERIARRGPLHDRLTKANIKTVEDFLTQLFIDPQRLQKEILEVDDKRWEVTVGHAQQCRIEKKEVDADKSVVSAFEHRVDVGLSDEEIALEGGSTQVSNAFKPSKSPRLESLSGDNFETSEMMAHDVHTQPSTSSPGGLPSLIEELLSDDNTFDIDFQLANQAHRDWEAFLNAKRVPTRWTMVSTVLRWRFSLRLLIKKRTLGLEGIHVEKKQRLS